VLGSLSIKTLLLVHNRNSYWVKVEERFAMLGVVTDDWHIQYIGPKYSLQWPLSVYHLQISIPIFIHVWYPLTVPTDKITLVRSRAFPKVCVNHNKPLVLTSLATPWQAGCASSQPSTTRCSLLRKLLIVIHNTIFLYFPVAITLKPNASRLKEYMVSVVG